MDGESHLWDLSPYDLQRQPQLIQLVPNQTVQTTGRMLESELRCAICLDILRNTRTTKECLHRFCEECIKQALRNGNKECPNCRKKLVSRRSLRPDPLFGEIIKTIFPNRVEMEEKEAELLATIDRLSGSQSSKKRNVDGSLRKSKDSVATASTAVSGIGNEEDVRIALEISAAPVEKFPSFSGLKSVQELLKKWKPSTRRIRVEGTANTTYVTKYILLRLLTDSHASKTAIDHLENDLDKIQIYLRMKNDDYKLLNSTQNLAAVRKNVWKSHEAMQLYFVITGGIRIK